MKPITYQGMTFTSYDQAAEYIGITKAGFAKRLKKYQANQLALDKLFSHDNLHLTKPITYQGQTFRNNVVAAQHIGISQPAFNRRLRKYKLGEMSLNELFSKSKYTVYDLPKYHDKQFHSKREAADFLGVSYNTLSKRLKKYHTGEYTLDDIFITPHNLQMRHTKGIKLQYKGHIFKNQQEACNYIGISQSAFSMRYRKYLSGNISLDALFRDKYHSLQD